MNIKKSIITALICAIAVLYSCSDNLSPLAPFEEEYALFCIIKADTAFQTVNLSRSYELNGFDPLKNRIDPALDGANVWIEVKSNSSIKTYRFQASSTARIDTSHYKTPFKYYSINNYKPAGLDSVKITAQLSNGKILKSELMVPPIEMLIYENFNYYYNPSMNNNSTLGLKFSWRIIGSPSYSIFCYYAPKLTIIYSKTDAPANKLSVNVPLYFFNKADTQLPVYPTISKSTNVWFYHDSIEKILLDISKDDPVKSNYTIYGAEFTLLLLDGNMAQYIGAENTFSDEFSMRIDAADFSNIKNGLGLFGSYAVKKSNIFFARFYIESFGYRSGSKLDF